MGQPEGRQRLEVTPKWCRKDRRWRRQRSSSPLRTRQARLTMHHSAADVALAQGWAAAPCPEEQAAGSWSCLVAAANHLAPLWRGLLFRRGRVSHPFGLSGRGQARRPRLFGQQCLLARTAKLLLNWR